MSSQPIESKPKLFLALNVAEFEHLLHGYLLGVALIEHEPLAVAQLAGPLANMASDTHDALGHAGAEHLLRRLIKDGTAAFGKSLRWQMEAGESDKPKPQPAKRGSRFQ